MNQNQQTKTEEQTLSAAQLVLRLANGLMADDDQKTCHFCEKDSWGIENHQPGCPIAQAKDLVETAQREASALRSQPPSQEVPRSLAQKAVEVCRDFFYSHREKMVEEYDCPSGADVCQTMLNRWKDIKAVAENQPEPDDLVPGDHEYVLAARSQYQREGSVEIDEGAIVSRGDEAGAYVQAWVWVALDTIPSAS